MDKNSKVAYCCHAAQIFHVGYWKQVRLSLFSIHAVALYLFPQILWMKDDYFIAYFHNQIKVKRIIELVWYKSSQMTWK